jgi:hypothetical protein
MGRTPERNRKKVENCQGPGLSATPGRHFCGEGPEAACLCVCLMLSHCVPCALMPSHCVSCCPMLSHICPANLTPDCPLSHVVSLPADLPRVSHAVSPCPMLSVSVPWRLMLSHVVSVLIFCAFDLSTYLRLSHAVPFSLIPSQSVSWHLMVSHAVSLQTKCRGLEATLLYSSNP